MLRLLETGLGLPPAEREPWLQGLTEDALVITRLRGLLAAESAAGRFLEQPVPSAALSSAFGLPETGDQLGAWLLGRELGRGGMGVVYLATRADGTFTQQAALKLMRGEFLLHDAPVRDKLAQRFENERQLLAELSHPNVARILDGGTTATGVPWLVMEYVEGVSLTDYSTQHRLDMPARLRLFCKLCSGVQAAHQHLIVHRDLKPGNVLVDAEGEPRLLDFGIARALGPQAAAAVTRTGVQAMTPAYASPEQMGHKPLTTASDVYSLGVILYELSTGALPYVLDGLSPAASEQVICHSQPNTLRHALWAGALPLTERQQRLAQIGGDLERIVQKAMHKEPTRRYASAQALAEDLQRYLAGQPVQAHPDSVGYRAGKFLRRHRWGSMAAMLALLAVLVAASIAFRQARRAEQAAADTGSVNAFLLDVLKMSSPYNSGSELSLSDALDEAAGRVNAHFGNRPDLAIAIHNALAQSMFSRNRLEAAENQIKLARSLSNTLYGPDDAHTVESLAILANIRKDQYRDNEARALFKDALQRLERSQQTGLPLYTDVLNDLGVLYLLGEDYAHAREYIQRALDRDTLAAGADRAAQEEHARTLGNLAHAERGLGHLDRADALYRQAQPILAALYPDGGPHLAVILNNRAKLARERGKLPEAFELQQQAVAMYRHAFKGDHVMVLVPITNLSAIALLTGRVDLAVQSGEEALAMADRLYAREPHPYQINALVALAAARLAQSDRAAASALLARAVKIKKLLDKVPASTARRLHELITRFCDGPAAHGDGLCVAAPADSAAPA
ncbi:MAG TPA: serine/threonine-protein kinase [Rhodanobacteraceae bacterium]|nr:serine/threonine-protein kinase [Rhodanobacteraceae bacterium]